MNKKSFAKILVTAAVVSIPAIAGATLTSAPGLSQTLASISAGKLTPSSVYVKDILASAGSAQAIVA
jgi:hypothetical protein